MRGLTLKPFGFILAAGIALAANFPVLPVFSATTPHPPLGRVLSPGPHPAVPRELGRRIVRHQLALATAQGSVRQSPARSSTATPLGAQWTSLGPQPIRGLSTYGNSAGRVTAVALRGSIVYIGTADGGVWRSANSGATWTALTDSQATLAIGAIAVDWSTSPETVYAATGERNLCQDCLPSQGVLKGTSIGGTWTWTLNGQATFSGGAFFFSSIVVDANNNQHILGATNQGLYQSMDGGQNWAQVPGTPSGHWDGLAQDPASPNLFWGAVTTSCTSPSYGEIGVWDANASLWTQKWPNGANPPVPVIRVGLGIGPSHTVYAALAACAQGSYGVGELEQIVKTTTGGSSWSIIAPGGSLPDYFSLGPGAGYQGWYDNVVAVDPTNANDAVFGGVTMLTTTNGGSTFTDVARPYSGGPLHPDFHAVAFTGVTGAFYAGNDGGVYSTSDFGGSGSPSDWNDLNAGLSITQFYAGSSIDLTHLAGGSQDNGTAGNPQGAAPAPWTSLLDGDGMWTSMFKGQSTLIGENSGLDMWQFDYSGTGTPTEVGPCASPYTDPSCSDPVGFVAPFVVDPTSTNAASARVYAGTDRVYRTTTGGLPAGGTSGGSWVPASPDLTSGTNPVTHRADWINTMATGAGTMSGTVITGSWYGKVFLTTSGPTASPTSTWIDITGNLPVWSLSASSGDSWITGVAVNPLDNTEAWVTIGTLGSSRIFHTHSATTPSPVWTDISTGLPAGLVVDSILVDPIKPQNVYIGTDAGAMVCTTCADPGATGSWVPLGTGLPNVRVDALTLTADAAEIVAWTHGRGAWYIPVPVGRPGAMLSPTSLSFGDQLVTSPPTTGVPQDVTLTNNGSAPLTITSITVSGDFQRVANANDCGALLAQGSSCTIRITFAPTQLGARTGTLTVNDNAVGSPQTASLSGNGVPPPGGKYNPVTPTRILDTRYGPYPVGQSSAAPVGPGGTISVHVADGATVPTNATAVVLNVTVTNTTSNGYLTVYPTGGSQPPLASNLNWAAGQTVPNLVEVQVGNGGQVTAFNGFGNTDVIFDLEGWVSPQTVNTVADGVFKPLVPYRITDTRYGPYPVGQTTAAQVQARQTVTIQVAGRPDAPNGVPVTGAEAVVLNVTVTNARGPSYLTVYPTGQGLPNASNLNFTTGQTVPNRVMVPLGSNGQVNIFNGWNATDVVVDVNGYFTDGNATPTITGRFTAVPPARILDTRYGPAPVGRPLGPVGPNQTIDVQVAGQGGVPAMTAPMPPRAVALNVTVTGTTANSYLIVYPSDAPSPPLASDLNWPPGTTVPNMVVVKLNASSGQIAIYNGLGSTQIIVDVLGWYS
jgi:hypothetical protein